MINSARLSRLLNNLEKNRLDSNKDVYIASIAGGFGYQITLVIVPQTNIQQVNIFFGNLGIEINPLNPHIQISLTDNEVQQIIKYYASRN